MRVLLAVLVLLALPAETWGMSVSFATVPEQPSAFQPFFAGNQPARVVIEVRDSEGRLVENVRVRLSIEHLRGLASGRILHTGFPYLEGKKVLGGEFFARDGRVEFSYNFPIRGTYRVEVEVLPTESSVSFQPFSQEFSVKVREQGYEIRNAVILVLLLLGFGAALGVIFGRASVRWKHEGS
ncbi:MAG: hypothetical protein GXN98_03810 [Euryarchaeota archaeon]|nr:hypothetical protein [Euryarchaeota archaeon]